MEEEKKEEEMKENVEVKVKKEKCCKCSRFSPFVITLMLIALLMLFQIVYNYVFTNSRVLTELENQKTQMAQYGEEYAQNFNEKELKEEIFLSISKEFIYPLFVPFILTIGFATIGYSLDNKR